MSAALAISHDLPTCAAPANDNASVAAGHVISQTLPSGRTLTYTPDGLGRTTALLAQINGQVQTLASGAQYFAGGAMQSMTYGNGLDFTQTLNARFLPETITVDGMSGGAFTTLKDLSYAYDNRGKVQTITDGTDVNETRS